MCALRRQRLHPAHVRPQAHHEAIQAARQRQETPEFKAQYALRAGVESSLSQGIRGFDLRRSRYIGLARTHLQQLLNATAMNVVRVIVWFWGEPLGERRRKPGHLARLAPHPLSRQTVMSEVSQLVRTERRARHHAPFLALDYWCYGAPPAHSDGH
jgi:hypothetical protein